jgi:hypothetical protein
MTQSTKIRIFRQGASVLLYPAALPLSRQTVTYVTGIIRRHRAQIGSPWRKLNPSEQALLVLAYLRMGETFAELAAGFGIGTATAWRYVSETVALAARSPKLRKAPGQGPVSSGGGVSDGGGETRGVPRPATPVGVRAARLPWQARQARSERQRRFPDPMWLCWPAA